MDAFITSMTTEFSALATSLVSWIGALVPVVLPIVGIGLVVTLGIRYFKKIASK